MKRDNGCCNTCVCLYRLPIVAFGFESWQESGLSMAGGHPQTQRPLPPTKATLLLIEKPRFPCDCWKGMGVGAGVGAARGASTAAGSPDDCASVRPWNSIATEAPAPVCRRAARAGSAESSERRQRMLRAVDATAATPTDSASEARSGCVPS